MRLLFDTNIILDIALMRIPHYQYSASIFSLIDNKKIVDFITATTITDIYYIAKKEKGHTISINFIKSLIQVVDVIGIDKETILQALSSKVFDFEDAIQSEASKINAIDYIITRNIKDFEQSEIPAMMPYDFLSLRKKKT